MPLAMDLYTPLYIGQSFHFYTVLFFATIALKNRDWQRGG
jgi:hypothetical protein